MLSKNDKLTIDHNELDSFATSDDRLRDLGWEIALIGSVHRDSDPIDQSNHRVLVRELESVDPDQLHHGVMHCNHWAVGWIDHVLVDTDNPQVMQIIEDCTAALSDYPILSDDDHSELECELHDNEECDKYCSICESENQ